GGTAAEPPPAPGPRGSSLLDMHFFMKPLRAAPCNFWSSAPNLQVAILSFGLTAKDGVLGSTATSTAAMKAYRAIGYSSPNCPSATLALKSGGAESPENDG